MTDNSNLISKIVQYENGELTDEEVIDLFQELVHTGLAWSLQGSYGRMAAHLIEAGEVEDCRLI
jgi:hypothetical protein